MEFSSDHRNLVSSSADGTARLWTLNVDEAIDRICATTRDVLTPQRWAQYVSPDLPYRPTCP